MSTILSTREAQVLHLIVFENSTFEIADSLYISPHTVRDHRKSILRKLSAKNTAGLVRKAFELGLIPLNRGIGSSQRAEAC